MFESFLRAKRYIESTLSARLTKLGCVNLPEFMNGRYIQAGEYLFEISPPIPGGKLDPLLVRDGYNLLNKTPFRVELIAAGFIHSQTMFFRAVQKQPLEEESSPGVYAIGTGDIAAMRVLNRRGQRVSMSLHRTLVHVDEAMISARRSNPRTVGRAQAYLVMRQRVPQTLYLNATSPTLENWRKAYQNRRNTGSLDDSAIAANDIYRQLQYLRPNKGERRTSSR